VEKLEARLDDRYQHRHLRRRGRTSELSCEEGPQSCGEAKGAGPGLGFGLGFGFASSRTAEEMRSSDRRTRAQKRAKWTPLRNGLAARAGQASVMMRGELTRRAIVMLERT
jgi:hypothetical protein